MAAAPLSRRRVLRELAGVGFAASVAGCSSDGDDDGGTTPAPTTTAASTTRTAASPTVPDATVAAATHPTYGELLVDRSGNTLYAFDPDEAGPSTCYGDCAAAWPPLTVADGDDVAAGTGVAADLATTEREDGRRQVTAGGWPLYYFANDGGPGEVAGQGVGNAWWVVRPDGTPARSTVSAADHEVLGRVLTDAAGHVLYVFTPDEGGPSTCYGGCAEAWPPLTVTGEDAPLPAATVEASVGTVERDDGSRQVTADGWPLYYYADDAEPGQARGQEVVNVWFAVRPDGSALMPTVSAREVPGHGEVLTDGDGMTLYAFDADGTGESTCYGDCAATWPPLMVEGEDAIVQSVRAAVTLGTTERDDGAMQVTAAGRPLYRYAGDEARGDAAGHGVNDAWWVLDPDGAVLTPTPTPDDDDDDDDAGGGGGSGY